MKVLLRALPKCILLFITWLLLPQLAFAKGEQDPITGPEEFSEKKGLFVEYFKYEEYVYSRSKKTELGDNVELDVGLRYQYDENTFGRLRFETDPVENRIDNKTSKFELLAGHRFQSIYFQVDGELNTNDGEGEATGGTTIGLDLDSELTVVSYTLADLVEFKFYPFNFDGEVGREFNTWDVTRIYFIDGAPDTVNDGEQIDDEKIAAKTIPGIELGLHLFNGTSYVYVGAGAASYLYPSNGNFDIETSRNADHWERKEDIGYKAGASFRGRHYTFELQYVTHTEPDETGALLESAGSIYHIGSFGRMILENELTYSKAGNNAYHLDRDGTWFEETSPYYPVYSEYDGDHQDWLGKEDFAYSLRLGFEAKPNFVPYIAYKHQGKHFIFRERESAHRLRTADLSQSHGGLNRYGFGGFIYFENFVINPEFEWLQAKNPVFSDSSDVREDRIFANFKKDDYLLFLTVRYDFGGSKAFVP